MLLQKSKTINFNPSIKEHRAAVVSFMKRNAWIDSPYRFADDPSYGSVADQVKTRMLQWYMEQEESRAKPKKSGKSVSRLAELGFNITDITHRLDGKHNIEIESTK